MKTIKAIIQASLLIKSEKADGVVGIIGGGVVVGCLAAKLSGVPAVGVVSTPNDTKISIKCNPTILLPESPLFNSKIIFQNILQLIIIYQSKLILLMVIKKIS